MESMLRPLFRQDPRMYKGPYTRMVDVYTLYKGIILNDELFHMRIYFLYSMYSHEQ